MFQIKKINLHRLKMTLNHPFSTSFGTVRDKDFYLIEVEDKDGYRGYGEVVAFSIPWYTEETIVTVRHIIEQFIIPQLRDKSLTHPQDLLPIFHSIKRNNMAKAAIEGAVWDLYAKRKKQTLSEALGGTRKAVPVGISLGMEKDTNDLLNKIDDHVAKGYKRIKIKVQKGQDIYVLAEVRAHFPNIPLMVDANSAYSLADIDHLKRFDQFNLMMIEQPLADDDIMEHAILQKELKTPICLDESILSLTDVKLAAQLGSCRVINIKAGRVGGLTQAKMIHDYCAEHAIDVWIGGMLDAGVGRAHNIALASLANVNLPGDIGASSHYWQEDIIEPEVVVTDGMITLSEAYGIGYEIDWEVVDKYREERKTFIL